MSSQEFDDLLKQVSHHTQNVGGGIFSTLLVLVLLLRCVAGEHLLEKLQR